ncbi:MAG TPA: hypothetical protein VIW92_01360 [Thermoanaerobaculia bacterium]
MTTKRHFARMLVRLAIPFAAFLAVGSTPGTADTRPQNGCTYGRLYMYYDQNGSVCAESATCNFTNWGDCDDNETFAYVEDYSQLCYCD